MNNNNQSIEIWKYSHQGYRPLVFSDGWQVAILNWEPGFDFNNLEMIERHNQTDEVFILWNGKAALFVTSCEEIRVEDMQTGVIYNVPKGVWHNLVTTRNASFFIVENRDTHLIDTEIRTMSDGEIERIRSKLPAWVSGG